jgi:Subtilase family
MKNFLSATYKTLMLIGLAQVLLFSNCKKTGLVLPDTTAAIATEAITEQLPAKHPLNSSDPINNPTYPARFKQNQIIIQYKEGITESQKAGFRTSMRIFLGLSGTEALAVTRCSSCSDEIELITARNAHLMMVVRGESSGTRGAGGPSGEGLLVARYALNIEIPPMNLENNQQNIGPNRITLKGAGTAIGIAVFDSGLDPALINPGNILSTISGSGCYPGDANGWNFADGNNRTNDDYAARHGTLVTGFILNQFLSTDLMPKILPVKIFDRMGNADMFKLLCSIKYESSKNIRLANFSMGFYSRNECTMLTDFIYNYLIKKGVLVLAAAGNDKKDIGTAIFNESDSTFFPAAYANASYINYHKDAALIAVPISNKVIAVTVANQLIVNPDLNYSNNTVDIGVRPMSSTGIDLRFRSPFSTEPLNYLNGTSFAAPVITGKIGNKYLSLYGTSSPAVSLVLKERAVAPGGALPVTVSPDLTTKIKNGRGIIQ